MCLYFIKEVICIKRRSDDLYLKTGIYGIRNLTNGRIYIGQTLMNFGDRRDTHFSLLRNGKHTCREMQDDFASVGENQFDFIILRECGEDEIDAQEIAFISMYSASNLCYNKCSGGRIGYKAPPISDEAKKKIGEKNRENMLGRKASDETRRKMSETRRGRKPGEMSEEGKIRSSIAHSGENSVLARLTKEQVVEIRRLRNEENLTYSEIGRRFGVTYQCVSDICNYKRWKYI